MWCLACWATFKLSEFQFITFQSNAYLEFTCVTMKSQVKQMSLTDILISPHGAQLTNMFLMDRDSSVMEFFPKGWLKHAGVGQYVYHWIASWSGMRHRGAWRDPDGVSCPYSDEDSRCMSFYKNGLIGYNETHFAEWARNVLNDVQTKRFEEESTKNGTASVRTCDCSQSVFVGA